MLTTLSMLFGESTDVAVDGPDDDLTHSHMRVREWLAEHPRGRSRAAADF